MNIFFNISHPAHVHFFKNIMWGLSAKKHKIIIGARKKEFTTELLEAYDFDYHVLTKKGNGLFGLGRELLVQQHMLYKLIKEHKIDIMLQIGGIFNAPIGRIMGVPTIAISDTENDVVGNTISFNLSKHTLLPTCFDSKSGRTWKNQINYPSYHELAYLSPDYFNYQTTCQNKFLVRFVGWGAGHDIGEKWLSNKQKTAIIETLEKYGDVFVSSEMALPENLRKYEFKLHPSEIHSFMKDCKLIVGESATMASEAACLGIPAIFISNTGRGYTTEQDRQYGLIKHFKVSQWERIERSLREWAAADLQNLWQEKKHRMLNDKINVSDWLIDFVDNYPLSLEAANKGNFSRFKITCAG